MQHVQQLTLPGIPLQTDALKGIQKAANKTLDFQYDFTTLRYSALQLFMFTLVNAWYDSRSKPVVLRCIPSRSYKKI